MLIFLQKEKVSDGEDSHISLFMYMPLLVPLIPQRRVTDRRVALLPIKLHCIETL